MSVDKLKILNLTPSKATSLEALRKDYNDTIERLLRHFRIAAIEAGRLRPAFDNDANYLTTTDTPPTTAATLTQIDTSKDGAPDSSIGVFFQWYTHNTSGATSTLTFKTTSSGTANVIAQIITGDNDTTYFPCFFNGSKSIWLNTSRNLATSQLRIASWIF
jgi:hypothetical protein